MLTSGTLRRSIVVLAKIALTSGGVSVAGLAGLPGGLPVGVYLDGIASRATRAGLKVRAEPALRALVAKVRLSNPAKAWKLAALVLNDVLSYRGGHVEQARLGAPVNPATNLNLAAVSRLRNDLHLIPLAK